MLARREHSAAELRQKLAARGFDAGEVEEVLCQLGREGLQSDARFAETWVHHRTQRGYGPVRIRQELRDRGVPAELIELNLDEADAEWFTRLVEVHRRKYGTSPPSSYREQARQSRFLYQRGFSAEQIRRLFRTDE